MPDWECRECTLLNDAAATNCTACGAARPRGRSLGSGPIGQDETEGLLPRTHRPPPPPPQSSSMLRDIFSFIGRNFTYIAIAVLTLLYLCATAVPAGHVGIIDLFGSVRPQPLSPGLHLVNPFARVHSVSVRTEVISVAEDVPTREGLSVHLEAAALYRLDAAKAAEMYRTIGMGALDAVVAANFHSVIREVTSGHDAKDLYTSATRTAMTCDLKNNLQTLLEDRGIIVEDTPLKKLELPSALQKSIEEKLLAEQASEKMQFILDKERLEADRKKIEAGGISTFQRIVSSDISEGLLRWKGIEATELIAESDNPKTVVIGSGPGMSFILPSDASAVVQHQPHAPQAGDPSAGQTITN